MRKGILKSFFSSGMQAIAVQVLGVLFIAVAAKEMPAESFGIIIWANAAAMFITTLLSFGMEQVVARRIASSNSSDWAAAAFLFHNFLGSIITFIIVGIVSYAFPKSIELRYLPLFFTAQALMFLVTPLKQYLNAKHRFAPYGIIAMVSNIVKITLALVLVSRGNLDIAMAGNILVVCALFELVALLVYVRLQTGFRLTFRTKAYKKLLAESAPQYMSVIFDSSLSRLDTILIGIIGTSAVITAEYGFAYRAYEVARLPIVIIAPIILNIFARMLAGNREINEEKQKLIELLYKMEMFGAMLIPLILNLVWAPVLDAFFDFKYGSANAPEFLLLSICIPLHFFTNLMWTIGFSARKYKRIATITMGSAVANLVLNLLLIPAYGGIGAAVAYLVTTLLQAVAYAMLINRIIPVSLVPMIKFFAVGCLAYISATYLGGAVLMQIAVAVGLYVAVGVALGWIKLTDFVVLKNEMNR